MKECVKRLWNTLKTTFLNVKLHRLCKSHHLQCITSSKDSEKLEKSLCVRDKVEDLCWMPVVFGPSDDTASLIGMILSLTLLNGPRNTHCSIICDLVLHGCKSKAEVGDWMQSLCQHYEHYEVCEFSQIGTKCLPSSRVYHDACVAIPLLVNKPQRIRVLRQNAGSCVTSTTCIHCENVSKTDTEEKKLLNKVIFFFAHKKYSRSVIT